VSLHALLLGAAITFTITLQEQDDYRQHDKPLSSVRCGVRMFSIQLTQCLVLLPADLETAYHTKLTLDWRTGVAATDWDTIAKKEHLDQLSVEMRKVEGAIREIYAEMLQLQQREQEMRDLNGEQLAPDPAASRGSVG
jgi:hypothetical protein